MKRRELLSWSYKLPIFLGLAPKVFSKEDESLSVPPIGMGTWITFNVGENKEALKQRLQVLEEFFRHGGGMIDSSPMYGSAEKVIGKLLPQVEQDGKIFSATKVWTSSRLEGEKQINNSFELWQTKQFDLFQIHNLVNWQEHIKTLQKLKESNKIRSLGITTSHGRRHADLLKIMNQVPIDFVQVTYNVVDKEVEDKILPLAREKNIQVIANRPYRGGSLINKCKAEPLPSWAKDMDCKSWADVLLGFIISHPAVDVAIPATTKIEHMKENMLAKRMTTLTSKQREFISKRIAQL